MVGRSIADIRPEGNIPLRSDIEAKDRPNILNIIYCTVSAQQTNLLPEDGS